MALITFFAAFIAFAVELSRLRRIVLVLLAQLSEYVCILTIVHLLLNLDLFVSGRLLFPAESRGLREADDLGALIVPALLTLADGVVRRQSRVQAFLRLLLRLIQAVQHLLVQGRPAQELACCSSAVDVLGVGQRLVRLLCQLVFLLLSPVLEDLRRAAFRLTDDLWGRLLAAPCASTSSHLGA